MSDLVERQFPAKALMTGLRAIGYSFRKKNPALW